MSLLAVANKGGTRNGASLFFTISVDVELYEPSTAEVPSAVRLGSELASSTVLSSSRESPTKRALALSKAYDSNRDVSDQERRRFEGGQRRADRTSTT